MNDPANLLNEAQAMLDQGQLIPARELFARVCAIDPANAEAHLMLGAIDAESGKVDDALRHTRQALTLDPAYEEAHLTLARLQQYRGELEEALASCARALAIDADYEEAWLVQSGLQGALGRYADSEQSSRQVIRLWPECPEAYVNLGNAQKAQERWSEAADSYRQALRLQPGLADLYAGIGDCCLATGDAEAALDAFTEALKLDPGHKVATLGSACALTLMERLEDAAAFSERALSYYPDSAEAHFVQGRVHQHRGEMDRAMAAYEKVRDIDPRHVRAHYYQGTVLQGLNDFENALARFRDTVRLQPDHAQAYFRMGNIHQLLRQLDQAVFNYEESLKYSRKAAEKQDAATAATAHTYCQLGFVYGSLLGDREAAVRNYRLALELDPDHVWARHYLAALGEGDAPERASDGFVANLFDAMSDNFDDILVGTLEYRTPQYLFEAVMQTLPGGSSGLDILDLGCGTGLCAPVFKGVAGYMAGVDLSPKMVAKARERNLYDHLETAELTDAMRGSDRKYDLVLAADVFVYIGKLDEVFAACAGVLKPGGLFAFSVEAATDGSDDFVLDKSGRYAHSSGYIEKLADRSDFEEAFTVSTVIRKEGGQPVAGMIFVLRKRD